MCWKLGHETSIEIGLSNHPDFQSLFFLLHENGPLTSQTMS
jgi:hypothetical protein